MKYFYEVGYWSHEECPSNTLMHEKFFSNEEFDELVSECMALAWKDRVYPSDDHVGDILEKTIEIMTKDFGFEEPVVQARFKPFGWASIIDDEDWLQDSDDELKLVRLKVKNYLKVGEDGICPISKEHCDDECCPPGAHCNVAGNNLKMFEPKNEEG